MPDGAAYRPSGRLPVRTASGKTVPPCFWPAGWPGGGWPGAVMFPHGQASVGWPGATHGARNGHSVPWLPHAKRKVTVPVACSTNRRHCVFTCPRRCSTWMTKAGAGGGRRGWAAAPPVPSGCDPRPAPPPVAAPTHRKHPVDPLNLRAIGPVISLPRPSLVPPGTKIGHTHGRSLLSENRQYHGQIETTLKRWGRAGTDLCPTWDKDWSRHRRAVQAGNCRGKGRKPSVNGLGYFRRSLREGCQAHRP